jgi:signal transduction histidine kinase
VIEQNSLANLQNITDALRTHQIELQKSNVELCRAKKDLENANAKMMLYQTRLLGLVAHQQNIKEAERIRIAREIHDELGSTLTAIKANLSVAMHEDRISGNLDNPRLTDACALLDVAMHAVRRVVSELRPSVLDQLGVWAALEWYAQQVQLRTGIHCQIEISDQVLETTLDGDRSTTLFRIMQESLTNVTRHAEADRVTIRVTINQCCVVMEIEDDGKGFDLAPCAAHGSWGIAGMVERARFFGGDLGISNISPGTLVTVRLPLKKNDD